MEDFFAVACSRHTETSTPTASLETRVVASTLRIVCRETSLTRCWDSCASRALDPMDACPRSAWIALTSAPASRRLGAQVGRSLGPLALMPAAWA